MTDSLVTYDIPDISNHLVSLSSAPWNQLQAHAQICLSNIKSIEPNFTQLYITIGKKLSVATSITLQL